jgi:hypothetical protein
MSQAGVLNVTENNPSIPTEFVTNSGIAVPLANTLDILGGVGITTSGAGNVVTITAIGMGFTWTAITSADNVKQITVENGYITNGAPTCILLLPAAAALGDTFIITGNTSLFQITQNAGQVIHFGSQTTTVGVGGSLTSTMVQDHIQILCIAANTTFKVTDSIGNLTVI